MHVCFLLHKVITMCKNKTTLIQSEHFRARMDTAQQIGLAY